MSLGYITLALVVLALATARATRLVVEDVITEPIRRWFVRRFGEDHKVTYLVHCVFCTSIWIGFAAAVFACAVLGISWWMLLPLTLALSQAAVFAHVVVDGR